MGFTLIEVIMSIVILSIISAIAGMGFVSMINGYVLAKKNAYTVQNAEIILTRLSKELTSTCCITSSNQTSLTFCSYSTMGTNPVCPATACPANTLLQYPQPLILSWDNTNKILLLGPAGNADTLANNVSSFSLSYFTKFDDVTASPTYLPASTALIKITLSLTGADNVATTFEERVFLYSLMTGT